MSACVCVCMCLGAHLEHGDGGVLVRQVGSDSEGRQAASALWENRVLVFLTLVSVSVSLSLSLSLALSLSLSVSLMFRLTTLVADAPHASKTVTASTLSWRAAT